LMPGGLPSSVFVTVRPPHLASTLPKS
jgi:hypothetical protein